MTTKDKNKKTNSGRVERERITETILNSGRVKRTDLPNNVTILTFYNDNAQAIKSGALQQGKTKLMKGHVNGVIDAIKELLTLMGITATIIAGGYAAYKGTEAIETAIETARMNEEAEEKYAFYAQSLNTNILLAFLREVEDNLYEKELANSLSQDEIDLSLDLQNELRKVEEIQLFYDQAIASGDSDLAKDYERQISTIISDATAMCGRKGHIIGSSDYAKYTQAIFYDGRIMYLASEVDRQDTGFEKNITFTINGVSYFTTPSEDENLKNIQ